MVKISAQASIVIEGPERFYVSGYIMDGVNSAPKVIRGEDRATYGEAMKDMWEIGSAALVEVCRLQEAEEKAGSAVPHVEPRLRAV